MLAVACRVKWLFWPVSVAGRTRAGRYLPCEVAALARIGGRYGVLAVVCRVKWLFWPVSVAGVARIGCYLPCEVAALARIGGRYGPYWPLFAV